MAIPDWDKSFRRKLRIQRPGIEAVNGFIAGRVVSDPAFGRSAEVIAFFTSAGTFHCFVIDPHTKRSTPSFYIDGIPYYYPIIGSGCKCDGKSVVDPATGCVRDRYATESGQAGNRFRAAYESLANDGKCESLSDFELVLVFREWDSLNFPEPVESFLLSRVGVNQDQ